MPNERTRFCNCPFSPRCTQHAVKLMIGGKLYIRRSLSTDSKWQCHHFHTHNVTSQRLSALVLLCLDNNTVPLIYCSVCFLIGECVELTVVAALGQLFFHSNCNVIKEWLGTYSQSLSNKLCQRADNSTYLAKCILYHARVHTLCRLIHYDY